MAITRAAATKARILTAPVLAGLLAAVLPQAGVAQSIAQSIAFIEQVGGDNQTAIDQAAGSNGLAEVKVGGNANLTDVIQNGSGNRAVVAVIGNRNGRGDVVGGTGRAMAFQSFVVERDKPGNGKNSNPGKGNPCGDGNGQGVGNPCSGNNGNSGSQGGAGGHGPAATTSLLAPLATLESGVVRQVGQGNAASVLVNGESNDFHVSQFGNGNKAVQALVGTFNQAATVQGTPGETTGSGNSAVQLQKGTGNSAYLHQAGSTNIAVQVQAGLVDGNKPAATAMAEYLLGSAATLANAAGNLNMRASAESVLSGMPAGGSDNTIALQQKGSNNFAELAQFGSGNTIALIQPGDATASVIQIGNNHNVGIEQQAGTNGVSAIAITQY